MSESESIHVSSEDLDALRNLRGKQAALLQSLGLLEFQRRKIQDEIDALMPRFAMSDHEYAHHFNRIRTKYGIAEGQKINESTGEVE